MVYHVIICLYVNIERKGLVILLFLFVVLAFGLLMSTLFAIERKLSKTNEQNDEIIHLLKRNKDA
ncbi:hypothetical protein [Shouchella patagoniensis]|uniref:hypothetical protein n=1 Tax=Shouchella patagoniensis TaxID=228576 RepID=UPI000994C184|nr:hypothetical protein [Shouchella patagoniensis]